MGLFGGGDQPDNQANELIEEQMRDNEIQIEQKRRSLYQTRLDVIKAQGAQQWTTPVTPGEGYKPAGRRAGGFNQEAYNRGMAKGQKALVRGFTGNQ